MRYGALVGALALAGCSSHSWQRLDGQALNSSAAIERQYAVDTASCRAVAMNAGAQIQAPMASSPNVAVTNNVIVQAPPSSNPYIVGNAPTPGSYAAPQVDFSGLNQAGQSLGTSIRRQRLEDANMRGCMAERGYLQAP